MELSNISILQKLTDHVQLLIQAIKESHQSNKEKVMVLKTASKRQENSFFKFLGIIDLLFQFCNFFQLLIEFHFFNGSNQQSLKFLNRCFTLLKRIQSKVVDNAWTVITEEIKEIIPFISKHLNSYSNK